MYAVRAIQKGRKKQPTQKSTNPMCKLSALSQLIMCRLLNAEMLIIQMIALTKHLIFFMVDICCVPLMRFSFYVFNDLCVNMLFLEIAFSHQTQRLIGHTQKKQFE